MTTWFLPRTAIGRYTFRSVSLETPGPGGKRPRPVHLGFIYLLLGLVGPGRYGTVPGATSPSVVLLPQPVGETVRRTRSPSEFSESSGRIGPVTGRGIWVLIWQVKLSGALRLGFTPHRADSPS